MMGSWKLRNAIWHMQEKKKIRMLKSPEYSMIMDNGMDNGR